MKNIKSIACVFGAATLAAALLGGCAPNEKDLAIPEAKTTFNINTLKNGNLVSDLRNGVHEITIPGESLENRTEDLNCVVIKQRSGRNAVSHGYLAMSCNW